MSFTWNIDPWPHLSPIPAVSLFQFIYPELMQNFRKKLKSSLLSYSKTDHGWTDRQGWLHRTQSSKPGVQNGFCGEKVEAEQVEKLRLLHVKAHKILHRSQENWKFDILPPLTPSGFPLTKFWCECVGGKIPPTCASRKGGGNGINTPILGGGIKHNFTNFLGKNTKKTYMAVIHNVPVRQYM